MFYILVGHCNFKVIAWIFVVVSCLWFLVVAVYCLCLLLFMAFSKMHRIH